ncbi:aminomethyltransferase [Devosia pacifica]|uniref:Aminomethyltransferase n=1 Tax=Devosia pacifica TaxID=1335967 RepID=A0A918SBC6_9HYPH|nr:folate-binding protein YgfZ [Devosia pacifica]GHA30246.1 aminomethyltransferase [Devosia pacifica]
MTRHLRSDRTLFRFSGPDAHTLLEDVLTGPFKPDATEAAWWALLSPQGKIQAEGLAVWRYEAWWLDVSTSVAENFFKRMRMYKLRAKAEIEDLSESHRVGWSSEPCEGSVPDNRGGGLGHHVLIAAENTEGWDTGEAYHEHRASIGIAELGPDFEADSTFPHDIAMDLLGGIDFAKGCYVGQEVVSRMKHRGTARRRPVLVSGIAEGTAAGTSVAAGGRDAGAIGTVHGGKAVGILRLDRISDASAAEIDGKPASLALPDWADYRFGESAPTE